MRTILPLSLVSVVLTLVGCPAQPGAPHFDTGGHDAATQDSGPHPSDAGSDASRDGASAIDASTSDDGGTDTGAMLDASLPDAATSVDANVVDANVVDANVVDANIVDANRPDGGNACVNAGGRCVGLNPTSCPAPGHVGDATMYGCGGGVGVECCLPGAASAAPVCMFTGTAQEGWYRPDGTLICIPNMPCAGLTATCQRIGQPSQGWYTTSGHGCPPLSQEIVHDATCG